MLQHFSQIAARVCTLVLFITLRNEEIANYLNTISRKSANVNIFNNAVKTQLTGYDIH